MEFKDDVLVDRELEIASYLRHELSMERIVGHTGLNRRIVQGHIRNLLEKLNVESVATLIKIIQSPTEKPQGIQPDEWAATQLKIREAGDLYFASIQSGNSHFHRRNYVSIGFALLAGVGSVLFVCDCLVKLFMSSDFLQDLQQLFEH